ncbi:MAG TPA: hypothetical protein VHM48_02520, partial [Candidatus Limnocylindrales bacterium]|nr:hypothetical protein [Candidatus Limnocylindrales bacterium]
MRFPVRALRSRLLPALLTAAGVTLLAAGLLHYGGPADARPAGASPSPSNVAVLPTPGFIVPSLPPIDGSPRPSVAPSPAANRVATRVVIDELGIDLPIIAQPNPRYPSCNVAMYYQDPRLGQPGSGRSIYLYAHARTGMFGPLYERAILGRGGGRKSLIGLPVEVYTSDDQRYVYTITGVRPNVKADSHFLDGPLAVKAETLWLQTSTGPNASYPKLQVVAQPLGVVPASHAEWLG